MVSLVKLKYVMSSDYASEIHNQRTVRAARHSFCVARPVKDCE